MKKYIWIAGTSCDLVYAGSKITIKTFGEIANKSGSKKIIEQTGFSSELMEMISNMEEMIRSWRDSYGEYDGR